MRKNGCKIKVESVVDSGSTFRVSVPAEKRPDWIVNDIELGSAKDLFVVDDDPEVLRYWKQHFRRGLGITVHGFDSPTKLPTSFPDDTVLIMDHHFPGEVVTGLGWLESNLHPQATYLSTVEYYDETVQVRVRKLRVKLLTK